MLNQPIPNVTMDDVERVVRRDFDSRLASEVWSILNEYGSEAWHEERARVQLAVLKLAAGNVERLRLHMNVAKTDYRDVLLPAEYPIYGNRVWPHAAPSPADLEQIYEADWKQYQDWLNH